MRCRIPPRRRAELEAIVRDHFGIDKIDGA